MVAASEEMDPAELDAVVAAAGALLGVAARSVIEVEDVVTTPQLRVLVFLASSGTQNIGSIANELRVHPSNATRACEKLLKAGLLTRTEDPRDRRYVRLDLTSAGSQLVQRVLSRRRDAVAEVLKWVPPGRRTTVAEAFKIFAEAAGAETVRTFEGDGRFLLHLPTD